MEAMPYGELWKKMAAEAAEADEDGYAPPTQKLREEFRQNFEKIRRDLGNTFAEILAREPEVGRDRIHDAIHQAISWKKWIRQPLEQIESAYMGVYAMHVEVNNGGFHQFFFNSAGDYWRDVLWLMREVHDTDGVRRLQQVTSVFPKGEPSVVRTERWKQLTDLEKWPWKKWRSNRHFRHHDLQYFEKPFPDRELFWKVVRERMPAVSIIWV